MEGFGYAKDEVTVQNGVEDFFAEALSEFYHSFMTCPPMPSPIYFNLRRCFGFKPTLTAPDTDKAIYGGFNSQDNDK